jgi:hypothetical protein
MPCPMLQSPSRIHVISARLSSPRTKTIKQSNTSGHDYNCRQQFDPRFALGQAWRLVEEATSTAKNRFVAALTKGTGPLPYIHTNLHRDAIAIYRFCCIRHPFLQAPCVALRINQVASTVVTVCFSMRQSLAH